MSMPKIIIIRGNSGSGKSTVARALQRKLGRGTPLISQDYVRREMLWVNDKPDNPAIDLLINLVAYGSVNCEHVILEGILYSEIYAKLFDRIKEIYGGNVFAYYFDLPFEETLRRHKYKPNANDFGETEMRRWFRDRDFLPNMYEKILYNEMSENDIVELIYNDIINA